jgi:hypothetical protein
MGRPRKEGVTRTLSGAISRAKTGRLWTVQAGTYARYVTEVAVPFEGDECLIWPYRRNDAGYGVTGRMLASRAVCIEAHGEPATPDLEAAHSCGNGAGGCVNPGHIRWATKAENNADKVLHGTVGSFGDQRGAANPSSKLTEDAVRHIKALKGTKTLADIGSMFGVHPAQISKIHAGKRWAHVS